MRKPLVALASLAVSLLIAESFLRSIDDDRFYVWKPGVTTVAHVVSGYMPGVEGRATFAINDVGLRADPFSDEQRFRILALGGSTTECFYLDTTEAWPRLLQDRLEAAWDVPVWVGNAGRSGHRSVHHVPQAMKLLEQYPRIDILLVLVGVNDFHQFLAKSAPGQWRPSFEELSPVRREATMRSAFEYLPPRRRVHGPLYRRMALWGLLERANAGLRPVLAQPTNVLDEGGEFYVERRRWRAAATTIRTELPSLKVVLREFRRNVRSIGVVARRHGVRPVFMTQPVMWREDLPATLRRLLGFGGLGDYFEKRSEVYYSVEALARGMRRFNETLLTTCARARLDCIDLAAMLPQDDTIFFDDCHFNENGAREVARLVAERLVQIVRPMGERASDVASASERD